LIYTLNKTFPLFFTRRMLSPPGMRREATDRGRQSPPPLKPQMECCLAKMMCNKSHLGIVYGYHSGGSSPKHLGGGARSHAMASAVAQVYNGDLGLEPPVGSRGRAPDGQGVRRQSPPLKLKHFWLFDIQWKPRICPHVKR